MNSEFSDGDHAFVPGSLVHKGLAQRLGLEPSTPMRRLVKALLLVLLTWLPLVLLSSFRQHALGRHVAMPLLLDPVIHSRFLFVVPLLELAQIVVEASLLVQMRHFLTSGLISAAERPKFDKASAFVRALRGSFRAEIVMAILAVCASVMTRFVLRYGTSASTWERAETSITPAGWWYILVSLPVLYFFLLNSLWVFILWATFIFRVSRLDLELTPTHPDRAGGLGFLGWSMASFAVILLAVSAMLSGGLARQMLHGGYSLNDLKYHIFLFVAVAIAILHLPLLFLAGKLARCRLRALLDFGSLIQAHDRAFDEKWIKPEHQPRESILGSPDVGSLADFSHAFEEIDRMRLIPFDKKALVVLIGAALIPMIPLVGMAFPPEVLFETLSELMF
jgi:hypothetical protein